MATFQKWESKLAVLEMSIGITQYEHKPRSSDKRTNKLQCEVKTAKIEEIQI